MGRHTFGPPLDNGLPDIVAVGRWGTADVAVYDLRTGAQLGLYLPDGDNGVLSLAITGDGRRLLVTTPGGTLTSIDIRALTAGAGPRVTPSSGG